MEMKITERVGPGWSDWKKWSTLGVLCDRSMPAKLPNGDHATEASDAIWGRNMDYNEETRTTD